MAIDGARVKKGVKQASAGQARDPFRITLTGEKERRFTEFLCDEIQRAVDARARLIQEDNLIDYWGALYEQARTHRDSPWPDSADLSSWIPTEKLDAMRARLSGIVFGVSPICEVDGYGEREERTAKVEVFHEWKAKDERLRTWVTKAIFCSLIEGDGILEVGEKSILRNLQKRDRFNLQTDQGAIRTDDKGNPFVAEDEAGNWVKWEGDAAIPSADVQYMERIQVCDGPQYSIVSLKDFAYLPGHAKDRSELWGWAKRSFLRVPILKMREKAGIYSNVAPLGTEGERMTQPSDLQKQTEVVAQEGPTAEKEIWEVQLSYDIDDDGVEEWLLATVSLAHRVLLRLEHDDLHQVRFVDFCPYPRYNSVYGYSFIGHKLWTLTEEHTALRNQIADRGTLAVNAPIKRLENALWNADEQPWGPDAVIDVRDMNEVQQMIVADVPQSTVYQKRDVEEAANRVTGMNDQSVIGVRSPQTVTATQVQTEAHASFTRIEEPVHYLQEALADLYQLRHGIWYRTLLGHEEGMTPRSSALIGLQTRGLTLPTDGPFKFTSEDLRGHFSFTPTGSIETADKGRQRADLTEFLARALPALLKISPNLAALFQSNPKFGDAIIQRAFSLYGMRDLQGLLAAAPPQPTMPPGLPPPPPGMPGEMPAGPEAGPPGVPAGLPPQLQQLIQLAMAHGANPVAGPTQPQ